MSDKINNRRHRLELNTPAEVAIYEAMQKVEDLGAEVRLTDIVVLLSKAKDQLADYIESEKEKEEQ